VVGGDAGRRCVVVGAGIAGLAAAFRLREAGFDVTVLEETDVVGGRMSCLRRDGWTVNRAAGILPGSYDSIKGLIRDACGPDAVSTRQPRIGIVRDGTVHVLRGTGPGAVLDGVRTGVLGARSKLLLGRLALDAARMAPVLSFEDLGRAQAFDTESAADYAERRLNSEIREFVVEPLVRGLFASDADRVSVVDFFFSAVRFMGGGLIRFAGGIDFLCRALAERVEVRTGARVLAVEHGARDVTVTWAQDGREHSETVAGVVLAVPGPAVSALYPQLDPVQRKVLDHEFEFSTAYVAHLALERRPGCPAMVVPVPRVEHPDLCVITLGHAMDPEAAPPGKGVIAAFWRHEWSVGHTGLPDDELVGLMTPAIERVLPEVGDGVRFAHLERWYPSVLRSYPGVYRHVAEFAARLDPTRRVQLAGDYLTASSTNGASVAGEAAAARLRRALA
jgi:protoporphyrinogen/coproporphyrinogen III oxidase